jgi:adenosylcobinamide kinase/adenosylcobinamide-phosphate guanylyltransferase
MKTTLVIGGCRSGKSSYAQALAEEIPGKKLYLATCIPQDEEMHARVGMHQDQRGPDWDTLEEPVKLAAAIKQKRLQFQKRLLNISRI